MPIYDMYPYSNLHELNLDFIIKLCEEFKDGVSDIEAQIQAVSDRVEVFENAFTFLSTPDGTVAHLAAALNVHGKLDVNGDIHAINGKVYTDGGLDGGLAEPVNITLTGDVEGTVSTDLKNDIEIQTTVVGGGGGSQEDVFFEGDLEFFDDPGGDPYSQANLSAPNGSIEANRLYTVIYDGVEYNHELSINDNGAIISEAPQGVLSFVIGNSFMTIPQVPAGTTKHVKIVREKYDLYYCGDPSSQLTLEDGRYKGMIDSVLPLELKTGDYVIFVDGTMMELTGVNTPMSNLDVGDFNSEQFTIAFRESLAATYKDYREYYIESATLPTDFKIFGPKQTGEMRYVKFFDPTGTGDTLTFPNEIVAGATLVVDNTNYMLQDSHDTAFCWQGKTYLGCSIPITMAAILYMVDGFGLTALFAAPNIGNAVMQVPIKDFKIYYTNNEYDDLYHDSGVHI